MTRGEESLPSAWGQPGLLDRAEDRRGNQEWVRELWRHPAARVLPVTSSGQVPWADGGVAYRVPSGELAEADLLLGLIEGAPVFAEISAEVDDPAVLRSVMDGLGPIDLQVAFEAVGLASWHSSTGFCGWCGMRTVASRGGLARTCPGCGRELFPRVDPAMIVAVTDADDRLLLGRQAIWEPGRMSVFAGFVSVGESLEQAVHREVFEEVGLRLADVRYSSSQPWPFPQSLMVAFTARACETSLTVDTAEIESAAWFSRSELEDALATGEVGLPFKTSVAYNLIAAWREGAL